MKIIVFGIERCKFCKIQKNYLKTAFKDEDWLYVDIVKDVENLRIASSVNIDNLPTIVLLDSKNRELYRKEGTLPADQIFSILNSKNNRKIPVFDQNSKKAFLSYDPNLIKGSKIEIYNFSGKFLKNAEIVSCKKVKVSSMKKNEKSAYMNIGGRKDVCWIVDFNIKKGDMEPK